MNNMLLCGTNGLTNFEKLAGFDLREQNVKLAMFRSHARRPGRLMYALCYWITSSRLGRVLDRHPRQRNAAAFFGLQAAPFQGLRRSSCPR